MSGQRSNPITPQGAVVINGYFDRHFANWRQRNVASGKTHKTFEVRHC